VAFDLAKEGDPLGAMQLIQEGIERDPENLDFYEQLGNFAFAAAEDIRREAMVTGGDGLTDEVKGLYREAITAYEKVFEGRPEPEDAEAASTRVAQIRNVGAAYMQLGELDRAIEFLSAALEAHPDEARLWALLADAYQRAERIEDAVAALERVEAIEPDYPQLHLRMGTFLIQLGDLDRAIPVLQQAVERGTPADQAARQIFAEAHRRFIASNNGRYSDFIDWVERAKTSFELSEDATAEMNFWHAFALYQIAVEAEKPETLETAQRTLPMFQRALELFRSARPYATSRRGTNYQQFLDAVNQYIEIQQAIIKRGR